MKHKFFLFLAFIGFFLGIAQKPDSVVTEVVTVEQIKKYNQNMVSADSLLQKHYETNNRITQRAFPENFRSKYSGNDFDYTSVKPKESLWSRIKRNIERILEKIFGKSYFSKANSYTDVLIRLFSILIIGFLVYVLIRVFVDKNGNFFFSKRNTQLKINSEDIEENIHEINFPEIISKYELQKNFRTAIRYRFLYLLKKLSDKGLIEWNPEKTNSDYLQELQNKVNEEDFKKLNYIFENVWYGEYEINEQQYSNFKTEFEKVTL